MTRREDRKGKLTDVTDANFQADVLESEDPVLVDFWAPGAVPAASSTWSSRRSTERSRSRSSA